MDKWEYKAYMPKKADWGRQALKQQSFGELDVLGQDGWELVSVSLVSSTMHILWDGPDAGYIFFFKRKLL